MFQGVLVLIDKRPEICFAFLRPADPPVDPFLRFVATLKEGQNESSMDRKIVMHQAEREASEHAELVIPPYTPIPKNKSDFSIAKEAERGRSSPPIVPEDRLILPFDVVRLVHVSNRRSFSPAVVANVAVRRSAVVPLRRDVAVVRRTGAKVALVLRWLNERTKKFDRSIEGEDGKGAARGASFLHSVSLD